MKPRPQDLGVADPAAEAFFLLQFHDADDVAPRQKYRGYPVCKVQPLDLGFLNVLLPALEAVSPPREMSSQVTIIVAKSVRPMHA